MSVTTKPNHYLLEDKVSIPYDECDTEVMIFAKVVELTKVGELDSRTIQDFQQMALEVINKFGPVEKRESKRPKNSI